MQQRPHYKFWPKRLPHSITVPATSLWHNLATSAARYPDKPALVFFGRVLSYREFEAQAERLAGALHALGVKRGDRVILDMQNCPQLVIAHFAILRANAVVVPVNPMNRAEELKHYITDPDAKVAIITGDLAGELAKASNALPREQQLEHMIVTQFTDAFDADASGDDAPAPAWKDWLTTRHPLPELANGKALAWTDALAAGHPPPAHVVGPTTWRCCPTPAAPPACPRAACTTTRASCTTPWPGRCGAIHVRGGGAGGGAHVPHHRHGEHDAHNMLAAATLVDHAALGPRRGRAADLALEGHGLDQHPDDGDRPDGQPQLRELRPVELNYIGGGGAAMPQAVAQRLYEQYGLKYQEGYGLTETAAPSHTNPSDNPKQQCLGIPFVSTDARVVDPDTLAEMPIGESGEIIIHGPEVFQGYWKRPDATQRPSSSSRASASSARATWAAWTRTATSS
jgi:fatty-acyl-CoA synthase